MATNPGRISVKRIFSFCKYESCSRADTYDTFYKKEDHEHTDTMQRSYCQNKGKQVSQKLLESKYTPYRTDVPMSYPPTGPVWWYIDKF